MLVGACAALVAVFVIASGRRSVAAGEYKELVRLWQEGAYQAVFEASEKQLEKSPMDGFILMLHGFSAYQIAISRPDSWSRNSYIDRCVWALRKAALTKEGERDVRVAYALGRAYHYKGPQYADLCVKYLEAARDASYDASDIPEFLGLAYASVQDYRSSVAAFTEALRREESPSDLLLLAIARSYIELKELEAARPYLIRCIEKSKDWQATARARLLLSGIMMDEGDIAGAENQVRLVLNEGGESAEARYRMGLIYNTKNDYYRARAEWRKAYNLDPNYAPVREKLNL